jgi:hypothetical protein
LHDEKKILEAVKDYFINLFQPTQYTYRVLPMDSFLSATEVRKLKRSASDSLLDTYAGDGLEGSDVVAHSLFPPACSY